MTKISIIIPVYNTAEYVGRCLDSVLSQEGVDLECIVVDDCGTDDSMRIVEKYVGGTEAANEKHWRNSEIKNDKFRSNSEIENGRIAEISAGGLEIQNEKLGEKHCEKFGKRQTEERNGVPHAEFSEKQAENPSGNRIKVVRHEYNEGLSAGRNGVPHTEFSEKQAENQSGNRIKVVRHEYNKGLSAGRNSGLSASTGEWIIYLDSDDTLPEGALKTMLNLTSEEIDWVQGGFNRISPEKEWQTLYPEAKYVSHAEISAAYDRINLTNVAGKLISRRLAEQIPFVEGVIFEDTLWCQMAYPKLQSIIVIDTPVYNHTIRPGSIMQSAFTPRKIESQLFIIGQIATMNPDTNQQRSATYIAMNLIKNLYLGNFEREYRKEILGKLSETDVFEMKINRCSLPPFTRVLSLRFTSRSGWYYGMMCSLYKAFKRIV